jgi:hypothetical protein
LITAKFTLIELINERGIGIDIDNKYRKIIEKRLKVETNL